MSILRVLHIWNTAGVGSVIAKYQKKYFKWITWVIMRKQWDPYNFTTYGECVDDNPYMFYMRALLLSRKFDIIHVHSLDKLSYFIKKVYKNKCIILHYHGTDIRGKWKKKEKLFKLVDLILVSTIDLYKEAPSKYKDKLIYYLPNPVDTELFRPMNMPKKDKTALYIYKPYYPSSELEWAKQVAHKYGLKLDIYDALHFKIEHTKLPYVLNRYYYFIDRKWIKSLSKLALEALACGLKVIKWDNSIIDKLPEDHHPKRVVFRLRKLYKNACNIN